MRLGQILVRLGLLTDVQVQKTLEKQRELEAKGEKKKIGELMIDMGLISDEDFLRAYDEQQRGSS